MNVHLGVHGCEVAELLEFLEEAVHAQQRDQAVLRNLHLNKAEGVRLKALA